MAGKSVVLTRFGDNISTRMALEVVAVALPIAIEAELPCPRGREADGVLILRLAEKVGDNHYIVRRSTFVPALKGNDFAFVVHVIDLGELPAEASRETTVVEPEPDEVAVQGHGSSREKFTGSGRFLFYKV